MADFFYKASLALIPRLYFGLTSLWLSSCRLEVIGRENLDQALTGGGAVVPIWHYSVFYVLHFLRQYPGVVMVSASKDGEYIARLAQLMGFETVRGSANRFGVRALKGLIDHIKKGKNAGIVADGSQGPPRVAQPGTILLAAKSGMPIIPIVWAVQHYTTVNSWDETVLPMPFSSMVLQYGEPIFVPPKITSVGVEKYRQQLERAMNGMYVQLWQKYGRTTHNRKGAL